MVAGRSSVGAFEGSDELIASKLTDKMQESLIPGAIGSGKEPGWWKPLEEVFRLE